MPRRYYSNAAVPTTITSAMDATQSTMVVAATTGYPTSFPFTLVIDKTVGGKAEVVSVVAVSGLTLTVQRAQDGTVGVTHTAGAIVTHDHTARDYADTEARLDALELSGTNSFVQQFLIGGY